MNTNKKTKKSVFIRVHPWPKFVFSRLLAVAARKRLPPDRALRALLRLHTIAQVDPSHGEEL
jgi:hypothetical protein